MYEFNKEIFVFENTSRNDAQRFQNTHMKFNQKNK